MNNILQGANSWSDFKESISALNTKEKGDAFEAFTQHYLRLDPKYALILKEVWHYKEVPPNIRQELNLPTLDEGIDLVAQTKAGGFWAIQCKYREDETQSLTRRELSTFTDLTFGICKNFEFALVCTTTSRFSSKLKAYGGRIGFCASDVWWALPKEYFQRLRNKMINENKIEEEDSNISLLVTLFEIYKGKT